VPYNLSQIIPVPSETGKSYGDLDEQYLTNSYRVYVTEAQARYMFAYIKQKQASSPICRNCQQHRVHLGRRELHGPAHSGSSHANDPEISSM
jgi:hypothetical protein